MGSQPALPRSFPSTNEVRKHIRWHMGFITVYMIPGWWFGTFGTLILLIWIDNSKGEPPLFIFFWGGSALQS